MGFFKEFKDDLSQAVNELLPEDNQNQEEHKTEESEEQMVNTLDTEDGAEDHNSEMEDMNEILDGFALDKAKEEVITTEDANQISAEENVENKEDEEESMDDNVDLELLEALNSGEETEKTETPKEEPKVKAASIANEDEVTVISKGTTINGSITTEGSLDVMGSITGDIECLGKLSITGRVQGNSSASEVYINSERLDGSIISEGSVKIGLGTVVVGDVTATSSVIAGAVKGEIDVNGPIVIDSTAIIKGNIKAKSVQINNGAIVDGFCSLSYASVDIDNIFE